MVRVQPRLTVCLLAIGLVGLVAHSQPTGAAPPSQTIQYQGRLTDSNGVPLEGTVEELTFRVFSSPSPSPPALWTEVHTDVSVRRGVFTVELGRNTTLPGDLFDGGPRYLEVQVGEDTPLSPLSRLGSVPFAISAGGSVPVGGIIDWYRPTATTPVPPGWEICDGRLVSDAESPLHAKRTPNLVGKFTRGLDPDQLTGYGYGPGEDPLLPDVGGLASHDLAHGHTVDAHSHSLNGHTHGLGSHTHPMPHVHQVTGRTHTANQNQPLPTGPNFSYAGGLFFHYHDVSMATQEPSASHTGTAVGTTDPATGNTGASSAGTSSALATIDNRPPFVGMLKIIRIK